VFGGAGSGDDGTGGEVGVGVSFDHFARSVSTPRTVMSRDHQEVQFHAPRDPSHTRTDL
jgi:hypothetical protein